MSRTALWLVTAAAAGFLAAAGVTLGLRLAGASPTPAPEARSCQEQVQRLTEEAGRLRRLVEAYRAREATYRQRLDEANRLLARLGSSGRAGGATRRREWEEPWAREEPWERWEHGD